MFRVASEPLFVQEPGCTLKTTLFVIFVQPHSNHHADGGGHAAAQEGGDDPLIARLLDTAAVGEGASSAVASESFPHMLATNSTAPLDAMRRRGWVLYRRYSEIAAFRRFLHLKFPGFSIPSLAPKSTKSPNVTASIVLRDFFSCLDRMLHNNNNDSSFSAAPFADSKLVAQFLVAPRIYRNNKKATTTCLTLPSSLSPAAPNVFIREAPLIPMRRDEDGFLLGSCQSCVDALRQADEVDRDVILSLDAEKEARAAVSSSGSAATSGAGNNSGGGGGGGSSLSSMIMSSMSKLSSGILASVMMTPSAGATNHNDERFSGNQNDDYENNSRAAEWARDDSEAFVGLLTSVMGSTAGGGDGGGGGGGGAGSATTSSSNVASASALVDAARLDVGKQLVQVCGASQQAALALREADHLAKERNGLMRSAAASLASIASALSSFGQVEVAHETAHCAAALSQSSGRAPPTTAAPPPRLLPDGVSTAAGATTASATRSVVSQTQSMLENTRLTASLALLATREGGGGGGRGRGTTSGVVGRLESAFAPERDDVVRQIVYAWELKAASLQDKEQHVRSRLSAGR